MGPAATAIERRTGEPSQKRLNHEAAVAERRDRPEVAERLQSAKEAGELERELAELDQEIIDLSGDIEAAKRERYFLEEIIGIDPAEDEDTTTTSRGEQMSKTREPEREEHERMIRAEEKERREEQKREAHRWRHDQQILEEKKRQKALEASIEKRERRETAEKREAAKRAERKAADQEAAKPITPQERKAWEAADQEQERREREGDIRPETEGGKKVREWDEEVRARVTSTEREARKADKVIVGKMDEARAEWKAHRAEEPEPPRGVFAPFKQSGFEREYAAWQATDQTLDKQAQELEKKHDRLEKTGRNHQGETAREVMAEMEKENPGRTKKVEKAREQEREREAAKRWEKTKEQITEMRKEREAGKGKGRGFDFDPFD